MARIRTIKPEFWVPSCEWWPFGPALYVAAENYGGPTKVGLASHPERRRSALQCGNPRDVHLIAIFVADRKDCCAIEKMILRNFAEARLRGEWMSVAPSEVLQFIETNCEVENG